jgi:hypothetical protein
MDEKNKYSNITLEQVKKNPLLLIFLSDLLTNTWELLDIPNMELGMSV